MKAKAIVGRLLEAPVNPDDPEKFLQHYKDSFEQAGFVRAEPDQQDVLRVSGFTPSVRQSWVWQNGIYVVVIDEHGNLGRPWYTVWGYIKSGKDPAGGVRRNIYASREVGTDKRALQVAQKYQKEMPTSMAARLIKLGFHGYANYWHRSLLDISLKKDAVNIELKYKFMPNEKAIKFLTGLNSVCDKFLGPPDEF